MGTDGHLHLPIGYSPEYPTIGTNGCPAGLAADCQHKNEPDVGYELALVRWLCQTLLDVTQRLQISDPQMSTWQSTLANLVSYPTDDTGFRISPAVALALGHRHYSHLLMVYPLYLVTPDTAADRSLIEKSLDHWIGLNVGAHTARGYTYTGAASISALLG